MEVLCQGCAMRWPLENGFHVDVRISYTPVDIEGYYLRALHGGFQMIPCTIELPIPTPQAA